MKISREFEFDWKKKLKILLSLIPVWISRWVFILSPSFIKKLDYFLLLNYPNLWLTRSHFILPITFVLVFFSPFLGFLLGKPLQTHGQYYSLLYGFYLVYLIFYAFWMVRDISPNKGGGFWGNIICVGAVYLCISLPYLVFTGFFWGYHYKIQSTMSDMQYSENLEVLQKGIQINKKINYIFLQNDWSEQRVFYFRDKFFIEEIKDLDDRTESERQKGVVRYESLLDNGGKLLEKSLISEKGMTYREQLIDDPKIASWIKLRRDPTNSSNGIQKFNGAHILSEKAFSRLEMYLQDFHFSKEIIQKGFWDRVEEERVGKSLYFHWELAIYFLFYISISLVFLYFLIVQFIPKENSWLWVLLFIAMVILIVLLFVFYFPTQISGWNHEQMKIRKLWFLEIIAIPYFLLLGVWVFSSYLTKKRKNFFYIGILFLLLLTPLVSYLSIEYLTLGYVADIVFFWIAGTTFSLVLGGFLLSRMEHIQCLPE